MTPLLRNPLLRLLTTRPQLLVDHAEAYGALGLVAWQATAAGWQRRVLLAALAGCCAIVAAVLAGTAGLLWAAQPAGALPADGDGWRLLQQQWQQDLQLLRDAAEAPR